MLACREVVDLDPVERSLFAATKSASANIPSWTSVAAPTNASRNSLDMNLHCCLCCVRPCRDSGRNHNVGRVISIFRHRNSSGEPLIPKLRPILQFKSTACSVVACLMLEVSLTYSPAVTSRPPPPRSATSNAYSQPKRKCGPASSPGQAAAQVTPTHKQIAAALAEDHEMPKKQTEAMLSDLAAITARRLKKGDRIRLTGLGIL